MNFENSKVSCALAVPLLYGMDNYAYSLNKILKLFSTRKSTVYKGLHRVGI